MSCGQHWGYDGTIKVGRRNSSCSLVESLIKSIRSLCPFLTGSYYSGSCWLICTFDPIYVDTLISAYKSYPAPAEDKTPLCLSTAAG